MTNLSNPARFEMTINSVLPLEWDVSAYLEDGQTISNVVVTLTRIDPYPTVLDTSGWADGSPSVVDPVITQVVDASYLSEAYTYQISVIFDTDSATTWEVRSILYIVPTLSVNSRGVTRKEIRQTLGIKSGDMVKCEASQAGSNVVFADANKLWRARDEYIGRIAYFIEGTVLNQGEMRKIIAADSAQAAVQWSIALPAAVAEGDEIELWSRQGQGWDPDEVNDIIRYAHQEANSHFPLAATAEVGAFSYDDPYIAVPTAFVAVTGISWTTPNLPYAADWVPIDRSRGRNSPGYYVEKETRRVIIAGNERSVASRGTIRIHGYIKEQPLDDDTSITNFNIEWLTARCQEVMWDQISMRSDKPQIAMNKVAQFRQEAMFKRTMVVPRRAANVDWIG